MRALCALAVLIFLCSSGRAFASGELSFVHLVRFDCPTCWKTEEASVAFQREAGENYFFVPVANGPEDRYPALWYALRDVVDQARLRNEIFRMLHVMRMPDSETGMLIEFLRVQDAAGGLSIADIERRMRSARTIDSMRKSARLMTVAGLSGVPSVALLRDGKVIRTVEFESGQEPQAFVRAALKAYREVK